MSDNDSIKVRGASEHNLANIDVDIPHGRLIAVTGVSGSGKSTLAFDTLFREGQRRYLETFSAYARRFLGKLDRPAVAHISGISPAIALEQKTSVTNPRSTVGTLSELYDHLRLLFARLGQVHCHQCGTAAQAVTSAAITKLILTRFRDQDISVLAPLVQDHRGSRKELLAQLASRGITEICVDGQILATTPLPQLEETQRHTIAAVTGHQKAGQTGGLREMVEKALDMGNQSLLIRVADQEERFSTQSACTDCGAGLPAAGTRLFSFNSAHGACLDCKGLGVGDRVDPDLLVADAAKSLRGGAMVPSTPTGYIVYSQVTIDVLNQICQAHGFDVDTPWSELLPEQKRVIFYGTERLKVPFGKHPLENRLKWSGITAKPREEGYYKGLIPTIEETLKRNRNKNILRFVRTTACTTCLGSRLRPEALAVTLGGNSIAHYANLPLRDLSESLSQFEADPLGRSILSSMSNRIAILLSLGLGYLDLARGAATLSSGETNRLRLATQVDGGLSGVLYVLDEPSSGLHLADRAPLRQALRELRDRGNTVLSVEHDEQGIREADMLLDLGPGAGTEGGQLLFAGPIANLAKADIAVSSPTRAYLTGEQTIPVPFKRRSGNGHQLRIINARENNLKGIDTVFHLGAFNAVSGVSGSGKSSLVDRILARVLRRQLHGATAVPGQHDGLQGAQTIAKIIHIDQSPIGRTPRSNPATYSGAMDAIRSLFAALPQARELGLGKGCFSINVKGGRCEPCGGAGCQVIGMHGFADVEVTCEECDGKRFNEAVLGITYRGKNAAQVLAMNVAEAVTLFEGSGAAERILRAMADLGLGYLALGQSATTLSGGEAQRVKLASELGRPTGGHTLYILDEPTTGLHPADIKILLTALDRLVEAGHTVLVVEHNPHVLKYADHLVDLGPGSGDDGGELVVTGTPEQVAATKYSLTGSALAPFLAEKNPPLPCPATLPPVPEPASIRLRGVRTHNLQGIDVTFPANRLSVITGVSGSGKSSLAFDTLFAEGQRRFAESLSTQARRYMDKSGSAVFEQADGISPTIAISQQPARGNNRSTVATRTGIYDSYRLLFARVGTVPCPNCRTLLHGGACPACHYQTSWPLSARMFSFNHHTGACPACDGLGFETFCDPLKLVNRPDKSLFNGAMDGSKAGRFYGDPHGQHLAILDEVGRIQHLDFQLPWCQLSQQARHIAMDGTDKTAYSVTWNYKRGQRSGDHQWQTEWKGFRAYISEEYERKRGDKRGLALRPLFTHIPCKTCGGARLKSPYREVLFAGESLPGLCAKTIDEARRFFAELAPHSTQRPLLVSVDLRADIVFRLQSLIDLGLGYLSLDRCMASLSGGEAQRLRMAAQLAAGLRGVTYVLDEPTVGLHPRDTAQLVAKLRDLVDQGNTVIAVEHDPLVLSKADYLVELGPGAGRHGGRLVAAGPPAEVWPDSLSGAWMDGRRSMPKRPPRGPGEQPIRIEAVHANNLKGFNLEIPSEGLVAITGVSGSGKSSLVFEVIAASATAGQPVGCKAIVGLEKFNRVITAAGIPLPGGTVGTPITRIGAYDHIRSLFAASEEARTQGFKKGMFSLGSKGGRCETCAGSGAVRIAMDFLPDVTSLCEDCDGKRFDEKTRNCRYRGKSINQVLDLTISTARVFFSDQPKIRQALQLLEDLGLGYLQLGQATATLSGGEARRLNLACTLNGAGKDRYLFLLDEPTAGLHLEDIARLLDLFAALLDAGHGLIVVTHHCHVIDAADWVIDLGLEGGVAGGNLVFQGRPKDLANQTFSHTGVALQAFAP